MTVTQDRFGGRGAGRAVGPHRGTVLAARTPGRAALPDRAPTPVEQERPVGQERPARQERSVQQERPARRERSAPQGRPVRQERKASAPRPRRRAPWVRDVTERVAAAVDAPAAPLPVSWPRTPFLVLVIALVVAGVVGVLVLNTKINESSFRLGDLRANQAVLDLQEQQLSQRLADLESPGNLRAAATRLGLVPAGTPAFISLPDGRVVGIPQPASAR